MTISKAKINRLQTGVPGLDEVLGGGLPEYSFNLIAGPPGSGKTTLAHQMMFALATPSGPRSISRCWASRRSRCCATSSSSSSSTATRSTARSASSTSATRPPPATCPRCSTASSREVETHRPALVFVDSFRSVMLAERTATSSFLSLQQFIQQLGMLMTSWQATTFLIGEYFAENDPNPVFTVADGLIWLRQSVERNSVVRKMEIAKMRGASDACRACTRSASARAASRCSRRRSGRDPIADPAAASPGLARLSLGVPDWTR